MMRGDYILGVDVSSIANMAVDTSALEAAAVQLTAQGDEANALSVATDINTYADEMVGRLAALGGQDALVASGTAIENQAYDIVANYDPNVGDPSVPGKVAALQTRMNAWQQQAYGPLRNAPTTAAPPGASPSAAAPPTPTTDPGAAGGDGGFSGGSSGGGDPGGIDWGDDDAGPADRGGGGLDDVGPSSADQGIDWGDEEVDDAREIEQPRSPSAMSTAEDGEVDPFASMLPADDGQSDGDVEAEDVVGNQYLSGIDQVLGGDVAIPTAGANYTDKKTVGAVQAALNDRGFGPLKVDGIMGPKTASAIRRMQAAAGIPQTGIVDEGVISALRVTPGVLPPGVTLQQKTAVEVQAAIDAATAVEHSVTPEDLQNAAAKVVDAAPVAPPELKQEAQQAHAAVLMATTPAAQAAAKQQVQAIAQKVQAAVAPGWWATPLWQGAPVNRLQGIVGGIGGVAIVVGVLAAVRR